MPSHIAVVAATSPLMMTNESWLGMVAATVAENSGGSGGGSKVGTPAAAALSAPGCKGTTPTATALPVPAAAASSAKSTPRAAPGGAAATEGGGSSKAATPVAAALSAPGSKAPTPTAAPLVPAAAGASSAKSTPRAAEPAAAGDAPQPPPTPPQETATEQPADAAATPTEAQAVPSAKEAAGGSPRPVADGGAEQEDGAAENRTPTAAAAAAQRPPSGRPHSSSSANGKPKVQISESLPVETAPEAAASTGKPAATTGAALNTTAGNDEPAPQHNAASLTEDPMVQYWNTKTAENRQHLHHQPTTATSSPTATHGDSHQARRRHNPEQRQHNASPLSSPNAANGPAGISSSVNANASRSGALPPLSLAERSIAARRAVEEVRAQHQFWVNRLRLLKAEALKIEAKQQQQQLHGNNSSHIASSSATHGASATSTSHSSADESQTMNVSMLATQTLNKQLEEGRRQEAGIRKERAAAIALQRTTHAKTIREARNALLENRRDLSRQVRSHSENHQSIVEALRAEDLQDRCKQRDKVQHEKVAMMLKRVRDSAMRAEEAKQLFEEKIQHLLADEETQQSEIVAIVQESSKLVQKIRTLRNGGSSPNGGGAR